MTRIQRREESGKVSLWLEFRVLMGDKLEE